MRALLALLLLMLAAPLAAQNDAAGLPETFDLRQFTCPLGGKEFSQDVGYAGFPLETLPDGSWLGDIAIDAQIPVCPDNGLVILPDYAAIAESDAQGMVYGGYSDAELALLPALIADPEYVSLKADGRHAQAYWLATRLDRPAAERFHLLQRATWAALAPELRRKLVARLVGDGPGLIAASDMPDAWKHGAGYYIVNGLRELGRFDEALAMLETLESEGAALAPADPDDIFGEALGPKIRLAVAGRDDGRFPIEMLGNRMVGLICNQVAPPPYDQRTPDNIAACEAHNERLAREADESERAYAERDAWLAKPEELERACASTQPDARSEGLSSACFPSEWERDERAADVLLLEQPEQVVADCARVPMGKREQVLSFACTGWESELRSAVSEQLAGDDAVYAAACFEGGKGDGSQDLSDIQLACSFAETLRLSREEERLFRDLPALDAACAATPEDDRDAGLRRACFTRMLDLEREERERVLADPEEFRRRCAGVPDPDYDTMSESELEEADFCETLRRFQREAQEKAAGLSCMDDLDLFAVDGNEGPAPPTRTCFPIEPSDSQPSPPRHDNENPELRRIARERAAQIVAAALAEAAGP